MVIVGASGHGKVIAETFEALFEGKPYHFMDRKPMDGFFAKEVVPEAPLPPGTELVLAIGNNSTRKRLAEGYREQTFLTLIHPAANISPSAHIGAGTVVMAGASINAEATIGQHVILNTNCSIDHDCRVADFVHISPNAALAGDVRVGEGTHIGIGASVIQGVTIGKWATIGAGAVIIEDVPEYAVVVGVPGKVIKYNKE